MKTLAQQIGQMLIVGFPGTTAPDYILDWLARGQIGGVILFARNVESPSQLAALCASCHRAAASNPDNPPILIAIDQEGGTVARLREQFGFTESPGAMALAVAAAGGAGGHELTEAVSEMLAAEMRAVGINWTLAPVVDITHDIRNPTVGTRSPGSDKTLVADIVTAEVRGFQRGGVAATAKHFPGLGNTPVDTHLALAVVSGSVEYLWEHDLVPFRAAVAAGVESVMISHVQFEELDALYPSTLSPAVIGKLLREDVGFTGVACSDCMEMKAVADHWGAGESAVLAALAGMDIVFFSHTRAMQEEAHAALLAAAESGRLPQARIAEAVARILALKARIAVREPLNPAAVYTPAHRSLAQDAARAGIVLVKGDLPVVMERAALGSAALVEFASWLDSQAMERGGASSLAEVLAQRGLHAPISLRQDDLAPDADPTPLNAARKAADSGRMLALFTRSAHLNAAQMAAARELIDRAQRAGGRVVLVALRNPFDADLFADADVIVCANGDSTPSVAAALDALLGVFAPSGVRTVT
jgi:beta-N-acetylhexosaminidase